PLPTAPPLFPYTTLFRSPRPCPTRDPRASRAGRDRWSLSRKAAPGGRRLRRASPTPAPDPDLAEDGRRGLRLLPSLHVEPQHVRSEEHTSELQSLRHLVC